MTDTVMLTGALTLIFAAAFAGAAIYINLVEHPARRELDDQSLLAQWQPSYKRAFAMQASLALMGGGFGIWAFYLGGDWRWVLGAIILIGNWPYTLLAITPLNNKLLALSPDAAVPETRALLERWNRLHAVRSLLGGAATLCFLWVLTG